MKLTEEQKEFEKKFKGKWMWNSAFDKSQDDPVMFKQWHHKYDNIFRTMCGEQCYFKGFTWSLFTNQNKQKFINQFWKNMPAWANYVAANKDKDGTIYWFYYITEPTYRKEGNYPYHVSDDEGYIPEEFYPTWYKGSIKSSLMRRPE